MPRIDRRAMIATVVAVVVLLSAGMLGAQLGDETTAAPPVVTAPTAPTVPTTPTTTQAAPSATSSASGESPATGTLFGAAFQTDRGESYEAGLQRTDAALGGLDFVRVFYKQEPEAWPGKAPNRNVVVSFKLDPRAVVAGAYDETMRNWFATAPRDYDVYWVYWHEPENDIEDGAFTAEEFKAAFVHLDELADEADNPRLSSAVVFQSFTLRPESGRAWRDYYPGDAVDVVAWDVYNRVARNPENPYASPAELFDGPREVSESLGKKWAVAELGSELAPGDDGSRRAQWLRDAGEYIKQNKAVFVAYFDFAWNGGQDDYKLRDQPSLQAWRDVSAAG